VRIIDKKSPLERGLRETSMHQPDIDGERSGENCLIIPGCTGNGVVLTITGVKNRHYQKLLVAPTSWLFQTTISLYVVMTALSTYWFNLSGKWRKSEKQVE
jgi:hypothetical protein